jgi:Zn-dependent protease
MIEFRLGTIPVRVQIWFFVTALLIGPHQLPGVALWLPVVLTGVLAHELGHALAVRRRGFTPEIELHGFGGLTSWRGEGSLRPGERAVISAAGPAVGITLGVAALAAARAIGPQSALLAETLRYVVWVNLGWGVLNLLPILPLDGGMILGSLAERLWGGHGMYAARVVSIVVCVAIGVSALAAGWLWSAVLAAVLAVSNIQAIRG